MTKCSCSFCGKTYEGDRDVVMRKSIVHLIFRHPKEALKLLLRDTKEGNSRDDISRCSECGCGYISPYDNTIDDIFIQITALTVEQK